MSSYLNDSTLEASIVGARFEDSTARWVKSNLSTMSCNINNDYVDGFGIARCQSVALLAEGSDITIIRSPISTSAGTANLNASILDAPEPALMSEASSYAVGIVADDSRIVVADQSSLTCYAGNAMGYINDYTISATADYSKPMQISGANIGIDQYGAGYLLVIDSVITATDGPANIGNDISAYYNTAPSTVSGSVFGVRVSNSVQGTLIDNIIVAASANSTVNSFKKTDDITSTATAVAVDWSGSGRLLLVRNTDINGTNSYSSVYCDDLDGNITASAITAGLRFASSGDLVAINNRILGAGSNAHTETTTADLSVASAKSAAVILGGTGTMALVHNALVGESAGVTATVYGTGTAQKEAFVNVVDVEDGTVLLVNNILHTTGDSTDMDTNILAVSGGGVTLAANDLWGSGFECLILSDTCVDTLTDVNDCTAWDMCTASTSNIDDDPQLAGYYIANTSPCVNAGVDPSTYGYPVDEDIDHDARPEGSSWDIGADEYVTP
jgi:hypothetical protein